MFFGPKLPILYAFLSAFLFGAATPASKALLVDLPPFQLAGVLYLGAAIGVIPLILKEGRLFPPWSAEKQTAAYLAGAVGFGGFLGPLFLLFGLSLTSSASVSLWLNLELVATAFLGVLFFKDSLTKVSGAAAMFMVTASAVLALSDVHAGWKAGLLVAFACTCWGFDNHFTALIRGVTPAQITLWKGVIAGSVNFVMGSIWQPVDLSFKTVTAAVIIGIFSYGISMVLYISSAQRLGAARSQVIFSGAPFIGVCLAVIFLKEPITSDLIVSGILMIVALFLIFFEKHGHPHFHQAVTHTHWHRHDDGHHDHDDNRVFHSHKHTHKKRYHTHPHWPDPDHRHEHDPEKNV